MEQSGRGPEAMSIGIWEIRMQISFGLRCRENLESCLVVKERDYESERQKGSWLVEAGGEVLI